MSQDEKIHVIRCFTCNLAEIAPEHAEPMFFIVSGYCCRKCSNAAVLHTMTRKEYEDGFNNDKGVGS